MPFRIQAPNQRKLQGGDICFGVHYHQWDEMTVVVAAGWVDLRWYAGSLEHLGNLMGGFGGTGRGIGYLVSLWWKTVIVV